MKKLIFPLLAAIVFCSACGNNQPGTHESPAATDAAPATAEDKATADEETTSGAQAQHREQPGQITAGEWRDADHWSFWQSLMKEDIYGNMREHWVFNLNKRMVVKAATQRGLPAADVPVKLLSADDEVLWEGCTDNKGSVSLFPYLKDKQKDLQGMKIEAGDNAVTYKINNGEEAVTRITVPFAPAKTLLDAAFVVDATGSMGDEMDYLKAELTDVIRKVSNDNTALEIRTGAVFYRDEEDDYLTRKSDFTEDISETVSFIQKQNAEGGGDFPEAVHTAMDVALNDLEWSDDARARLMFLVLDAPPHDDPAIIKKINRLVALASRKGVRLIPVVSSGIDKETEFLMRYMAIATGGTYIFLTDDSGIGNSHLQPTIGKYEVEYLNDLMVRVIDGYVARGGNSDLQ